MLEGSVHFRQSALFPRASNTYSAFWYTLHTLQKLGFRSSRFCNSCFTSCQILNVHRELSFMMSISRKLMLIGKVVEKLAPKIALVEVQTNELNEYMRMVCRSYFASGIFSWYLHFLQYYARYTDYRVDDGAHSSKIGDYVLIRSKENPERLDLPCEVAEVVHRTGQLQDPITKKRVVIDVHRVDYLEDQQYINKLLPDWKEQKGLVYSDKDITEGTPQHPRDKSSLYWIFLSVFFDSFLLQGNCQCDSLWVEICGFS